MRTKRNLMGALVGFAMLATPITAAAKDHGRNFQNSARASHAARTFAAPVRTFTPAPAARNFGFRNNAQRAIPFNTVNRAPRFNQNFIPPGHLHAPGWNRNWNNTQAFVPVGHRDWEDEEEEHEHYNGTPAVVCDEDGDDCRTVGGYQGGYQGGYYPNYGYGAGNYQTGNAASACVEAQRLQNQYRRDRATGHPAAAADLLRKISRMQSYCGGAPVGRGLLGGLGGAPFGNGLLGGLGAPAYNNYGYNGGYNQPYNNGYGSSLAPLLQQFIP